MLLVILVYFIDLFMANVALNGGFELYNVTYNLKNLHA